MGSPKVRRKLAALADKELNFKLADLQRFTPGHGWQVEDLCQALPPEPPGQPVTAGTWEVARGVMRGYEFADPSIARAFYDTDVPLEKRNMLLKLQFHGLVWLFVGVRTGDVHDETRWVGGRSVRVWGWNYRTLEGHVEMGQMDWEVWKWLDSGQVEFRVHAVSRPARIDNPFVRLGFHVLRRHQRRLFLESTARRMLRFTEIGLEHERSERPIRQAGDHQEPRCQPSTSKL